MGLHRLLFVLYQQQLLLCRTLPAAHTHATESYIENNNYYYKACIVVFYTSRQCFFLYIYAISAHE